MLATHKRLVAEAEKLADAIKPEASPSKKKRAREAKRMVALVKMAIDEGRIEDDLKGIKMEKVQSKASTKQAMVARVRYSEWYLFCADYTLIRYL
jgi:ubiquitin carboxyl-terminal hydrolase 1